MTTFFLPSLSEIVINALLIEYERGPVFCLTDSPDVVNALQLLGITSFLVEYKSKKPEETDRLFAQIWQDVPGGASHTLGLDRFKLFFNPAGLDIFEFTMSLSPQKVVFSLDLHSPLTYWAQEIRAEETTGIQSQYIRTKEMLLYLQHIHADKLIIQRGCDTEFVKRATEGRVLIESVESGPEYFPKGDPTNAVAVIFDKRDEFQFNIFSQRFPVRGVAIPDPRSIEIWQKVYGGPYTKVQNLPQETELVAFRWDEYCEGHRVSVMDYHNTNMAKEVAPMGTPIYT